jgi:hypothetical protein
MNKKKILIIAASLLMLGAVAVKPAMAYFTDTHDAKGAATFKHIEIKPYEDIDGFTKIVRIENTGDAPVYVRVKFFAGNSEVHKLTTDDERTHGWALKEDGFYYYNDVVPAGDVNNVTDTLAVKVDPGLDEDPYFNVIVVSEAAPLKADGTADWDNVSDANKQLFDGKGGVE